MDISQMVDLVVPQEAEEVSLVQLSELVDAAEHDFGSLDFHTKHSQLLGDPFEICAAMEESMGGPLALCTTVIIGPSTNP